MNSSRLIAVKNEFTNAYQLIIVPALETLKHMTLSQLSNLHPTQVLFSLDANGENVAGLGFEMSDGSLVLHKDSDVKTKLPKNIKSVEVAFLQNEDYVHSITFHGDSVLTVGAIDRINKKDEDVQKGRVE